MKYSIILAIATATIVGALPQGGPDNAAKAKLPFLTEPIYNGIYCRETRSRRRFTLSDPNCGTQQFCEAFDNQDELQADGMGEPEYKSAQDCFDAHEPKLESAKPKLPFLTWPIHSGMYCRERRSRSWFTLSDPTCGTQRFCEAFDNQDELQADGMGEPEYKSAQDCFNAHEPKPALAGSAFPPAV
ncbi:hypothetical protein CRV24_007465 [Beauveria bassiana]|nr:hypothetical protein CRV24_007465 [Beauveria bassiana]KAH8712344.1 hypothetical protein HC256_005542 [Beauveria bassiana]